MIFSYITKYKPNIDTGSPIECYKPLMFSNNRNYSTIRNLTRADIALQHVGKDVLSQPRLPVKRNE